MSSQAVDDLRYYRVGPGAINVGKMQSTKSAACVDSCGATTIGAEPDDWKWRTCKVERRGGQLSTFRGVKAAAVKDRHSPSRDEGFPWTSAHANVEQCGDASQFHLA